MIYRTVKVILDYLEKTMRNLFTITTIIQGHFLGKKSPETLNKTLETGLMKSSFFSQVASP